MRRRPLGQTGLDVSELSLGGLFVSNYDGDFEQSRRAVLRAIELGINYIDTAPTYGNSEEVLGRIFREVKTPLIVSTKLGGRPQPFDPRNPAHLVQSVEESLRLLGRQTIDVLMIHEPDRPGQYDWWTDRDSVDGPVVKVLEDLKRAGKIRFTGLGGTTAYEMARIVRARRFDVLLTAFNYSLLWREAEIEVLPEAAQRGMGIVIGSPLQQGALAVRRDEEVRTSHWLSKPRREQFLALYRLLDEIEMVLPELALRFVLSNPRISCTLSGARSVEEIERNVEAAARGPLPADVLNRLDAIAARVPFRPFDEPFLFPLGRDYHGPGPAC